jgi:DNA replication ATP-dependent helicase Dna2
VKGESIGVIAPYRGQVEVLKKFLGHVSSVEVNTVDQYQGRDKEIIIYSCTQSVRTEPDSQKSQSDVEILDDRRRLTVAITRAKHKLIIIGDVNCLNNYTPFNDLFKHMSSLSKHEIKDEKSGFSWTTMLEKLKEKKF